MMSRKVSFILCALFLLGNLILLSVMYIPTAYTQPNSAITETKELTVDIFERKIGWQRVFDSFLTADGNLVDVLETLGESKNSQFNIIQDWLSYELHSEISYPKLNIWQEVTPTDNDTFLEFSYTQPRAQGQYGIVYLFHICG